jgi:SAM-dependent methyltransferase
MKGIISEVSIESRERALLIPESRELLVALAPEIREVFVRCFLDGDTKSADAEIVRNFFRKNAEIPNIVETDTTSSITFEWLYHRRLADNPIDKFFCDCESGRQIFQRLIALRSNMPGIIRRQFEGKKILIDNIGSGPGHDMIEVMAENPDLADIVNIRHIDPDSSALAIGEKRVKKFGLQNSFSFVNDRLESFSNGDTDIIMAIGIFCPLPMGTSKRVLRSLIKHLRSGGIIVYSTAQEKMQRDLVCGYIMRLFGWNMSHKTDEQAVNLAQSIGLEFVDWFFDEPFHHHCMVIAKKP